MKKRVLLCEPGYTNPFLHDDDLVDCTRLDERDLDGSDEVYYRECITDRLQIAEGWKKQPEPEVWCLVSGKRTGSTLIIDYLQKCQPQTVLALSEIFNVGNAYMDSFDMTNERGVLCPYRRLFRENTGDDGAYFQQFVDFAGSRLGTTRLVFKYTVDFLYDYDGFVAQHERIFRFLRENNARLVYLNRNELESYISYKMALTYGFSNTVYPGIPPGIFDLNELHTFSVNKHAFEALFFRESRIEKWLDYAMVSEDHEKNLAWIRDVFGLEAEEACRFDTINEKQNAFSYEAFLDRKNWK